VFGRLKRVEVGWSGQNLLDGRRWKATRRSRNDRLRTLPRLNNERRVQRSSISTVSRKNANCFVFFMIDNNSNPSQCDSNQDRCNAINGAAPARRENTRPAFPKVLLGVTQRLLLLRSGPIYLFIVLPHAGNVDVLPWPPFVC